MKLDVGGQAGLSIGKDGAVDVESSAGIEIKGNEITIEAVGKLKLKGATVDIN